MSEKSSSSQPQSKFRSYIIRLFQVFIVICLVDGFLDISYPLAAFTKKNLKTIIFDIKNSGLTKSIKSQDIALPASGFLLRNKPGIRNIVAEYHSPSINVAADGLRYNGQPPPENVSSVGILLGSSTAFGYGVADNQTIAAQLERLLNHTKVYNYAGLAQPIPDNILRWYDFQKKNERPDFVILVGTNYQLYEDCKPIFMKDIPTVFHSNVFAYLVRNLSKEKIMPCESNENLELAVRNSIISIENAVMFARKQGIPFYIINIPTPYDANVNINNLLNNTEAIAKIATLRKVFSHYHQELTKLDIPELIDLSDALPIDKNYFLDLGGHLSKEGNKVISEKLFDHIWGNKSQTTTRLPRHIH